MTSVFFSGSRQFSQLPRAVKDRADKIIGQGFTFLIGDADGADTLMQKYLAEKGYGKVVIFCTGPICRNNVGRWNTVHVAPATGTPKGFLFYALKDKKMSDEATYGFVLWNGKSKGSLNNIINLLKQGKKVVLYHSPSAKFHSLKTREDLSALMAEGQGGSVEKCEQKTNKGSGVRQKQLSYM